MTRDGHLEFGLLMTPGWVVRPIREQVAGHLFAHLPTNEAASVLEGVALLQWVRAGVVGAVLVVASYLAHGAVPGSGATAWIFFTLLTWLPAYMLLLAICRLLLRKSSRASAPIASAHPRVLATVKWAPHASLLAAAASAIALA